MRASCQTVLVAVVAAAVGFAAAPAMRYPVRSPHAEALDLVLRTQADEIHKAEVAARPRGKGTDHWWHDTMHRTWLVQRPFSPGVIDSTHLFQVTYEVNGEARRWWVDTRAGKVGRTHVLKK
jgi:hypothetical protein